ncbi:TPA: hypothetical protein RNK76_001519 [Shigella sonnei]|uniref:hypothetical protein n=1 Tax=Escherichia coli TaxID=562 RepID=UPI00177A5992|nr:hypothetical protein [Escherichia coli]HDX0321886.1 hypothetical protein [Shigella sonnei]HAH7135018.1 hypothetical protein [Escherichia coli]HAJ8743516.1 hypothetical protein [Escherichia coli]HDX0361062.1 hypothetical protein [Shigella sonnei]HDX0374240.1 hypothetical protein [Shigella sonnei]
MNITQDNLDIFTGSHVEVSISNQIDNQVDFFDPSFSSIENVAAFPTLTESTEIETLEEYDQDATGKLAGYRRLEPTTLTLNRVLDDEHQAMLMKAVEDKTPLRFRMFYVVNSGYSAANTGYYVIYDAYVTSHKTRGSDNKAVTLEFKLEPDGGILDRGIATEGRLLRRGDYGVGAGVHPFTGPIDSDALAGNRFVTYKGTASTNPYGADTSLIHLQANEHGAWQLTCNTSGAPRLRVRNIQENGKSGWIKVYSDAERPTAQDVGAVSITARVDFGEY